MSLAALGPCTSIFHLSFNAFRALSLSTTSLVSQVFALLTHPAPPGLFTPLPALTHPQALAVGDRRRVRHVVLQAMGLAGLIGTLVATLLTRWGPRALKLMGAPPASALSR
jgi:Na+-driven multidrug efflux pump